MMEQIIERRFKLRFSLKYIGSVVLGLAIISLIIYLAMPRPDLSHYASVIHSFLKAEDTLHLAVIIGIIIETIIISILVILTAVFASHKIAGPVFRLKKTLQEFEKVGEVSPICFRHYDQLQGTAHVFNEMLDGINEKMHLISKAYNRVAEAIDNLDTPESIETLKERVNELGKEINRFSL